MNTFTEKIQLSSQVYSEIVSRCHTDTKFKKNFIEDPKSTLESFLGSSFNLPSGMRIQVIDQSNDGEVYINIPNQQNVISINNKIRENSSLSEEELDQVVGGGIFAIDCPAWAIGAIGVAVGGLALNAAINIADGIWDGLTDGQ